MVFLLWAEQEEQMKLSLTVNLEKDGTVGAVKTERTHQQRGNDWPHWTVKRDGSGRNQTDRSQRVNRLTLLYSVMHCKDVSQGRGLADEK